jgi:hypothetical protein
MLKVVEPHAQAPLIRRDPRVPLWKGCPTETEKCLMRQKAPTNQWRLIVES